MQKLCFSYVRYSSWTQRNSDSVKRQNEMVARWLLEHPEYDLSEQRYYDHGKSGYHGDHLDNAFGRLLAAVENGDIPRGSKILIEQIDRAGRLAPMEMLPLVSKIVNAGVDLVTLDDGITYNRESANSNHLFLLVAKVQQAYQYSDNLSRRLKAAYETKRQKAAAGEGATRRMPLWIRDGKLRDDIAPFIVQVFEDFAAGIGERRILGRLKDQHPDLSTISPSTFRRWLRNPVAVGRWNDIEDVWPAVVSKELWFRVQKRINDGAAPKAAASKYLLTGIVKCARCGKNYCVGGQKGALTMVCVSRHRFGGGAGGCTNSRSIPYAVFDFIRSQTAHAALVRAAQSQNLTASEKRLIEIDGELAELQRQSENVSQGLAKYGMIKAITDELDRLTAQLTKLEQERILLKATPAPITMDDMLSLEDDLLDDDTVKLNALLQGVGYSLVVDDRTITVAESGVFSALDAQSYRYLGSDRVKGVYKLVINEETLTELTNLDSKVQKAHYETQMKDEAEIATEIKQLVADGKFTEVVYHFDGVTGNTAIKPL